jgi:uncharacterized protein YecT (DUF1311 family)
VGVGQSCRHRLNAPLQSGGRSLTPGRAFLASLLLYLGGIGNAVAANVCDTACPSNDTRDWVACFEGQTQQYVSQLNSYYETLEKGLSATAAADLTTAQQSWASYRDNKCEAEGSFAGGTLALVAQAGCVCITTYVRMSELQEYVNTYVSGKAQRHLP